MKKLTPQTPPGELIDVGGYRLHLHCMGSGTPTVVLEAGPGGFSSAWSLVQPAVARFTRVCSYDRAGFGWSERAPSSMPRTSEQLARELHVLLHRAGIRPPLLLVGHASGGFHVRLYASRFPDEVAGMVLVDPANEDEWTAPNTHGHLQRLKVGKRRLRGYYVLSRLGLLQLFARFKPPEAVRKLPPHEQAVVRRLGVRPGTLQTTYREFDALAESAAQVREEAGFLGERPLVIVRSVGAAPHSAGAEESRGPPVMLSMSEAHAQLAGLSTRGRLLVAEGSSANVPVDEPELVVEAIREVVALVRATSSPAAEQL